MEKNKRNWQLAPMKSPKVKLSEIDKIRIQNYFLPLIESFKGQFIKENPDKEYNYLIDIYSKWYQNYFYLCEKFKSEYPNRLADDFEVKFVRLKYTAKDQFEFSYFRHTGKWNQVADGLTLDECREMILSSPVFQPIG